ncbi:hypothetical protein B0T20DRAFT_426282 [Sordaria brevicollis]|uniref:Uncharacterized protein n=1 Tax=Sordaria brevicollis TaxID=83679 RepID=A0AAE0NW49_SORBR|nr:hypothetical protein B0T20DRAFT_426282 [Sordaria brevicollis]
MMCFNKWANRRVAAWLFAPMIQTAFAEDIKPNTTVQVLVPMVVSKHSTTRYTFHASVFNANSDSSLTGPKQPQRYHRNCRQHCFGTTPPRQQQHRKHC